ncbi:TrbI/VirB10 family protein [Sphingopyxis sp. NJF-3]
MTGAQEAIPAAELPSPDIVPAEPFRLTPEPPHVMRLSRKALAVVGGTAGIVIGGALFWALRPAVHEAPENLYDAAANNRSEAVTGAPKDYGAIPKLGPPPPGELGRSLASAQQDGEPVPLPSMGQGPSSPDPARTAAEQARQRAQQEREAARSSRLFGAAAVETASLPPDVPLSSQPDPSAAGRTPFLAQNGQVAESAERIRPASSPYIVQAGSVIPAALITGINSDLPGQITAQVTQNVFDSPTGRHLLIPQGARLIGEYDSEVAAGQDRVLLAWDRLILPGGRSIKLDRQPGADVRGMAGLADRVDHHWGRIFRAALVSTLFGAGAELVASGEDELVRAIREGSQDAVSQTGRRLAEREIGIEPTIRIRPGFAFRVIVTRDLILEPLESRP